MKRDWHFLPADRRLRYGDGREIKPGSVVTVPDDKPLDLCRYGLHASRGALDCLKYAPGPIVCRVTLHGEVIDGDDKSVAYERRVIWMADATDALREFAYWCADRAVRVHAVAALRAAGMVDHADKLAALPKIVDRETAERASAAARAARAASAASAARSTASAAAGSAAGYAAGYAAWAAAWDAECAAAWDAARDAAGYAAWAAAWDAECAAAWDAARDAECAIQDKRLTAALLALKPGGAS